MEGGKSREVRERCDGNLRTWNAGRVVSMEKEGTAATDQAEPETNTTPPRGSSEPARPGLWKKNRCGLRRTRFLTRRLKITGSIGFPKSAFRGCEPVIFSAACLGYFSVVLLPSAPNKRVLAGIRNYKKREPEPGKTGTQLSLIHI